ncbi:MAG: HAMP domain-containing sensor histidine kinase [Flavobacterium sp.]|nr:HAMP domain-containing sensor histidine kinase [Flavobacterium sp.]
MIQQWLNWRTILGLVAVLIASGTILYSQFLAKKIATQERKNVEILVEAQRTILNASDTASINLATKIASENKNIPIIETNEKDSLTYNYLNLDTLAVKQDKNYLATTLEAFKAYAPPVVLVISEKPYIANKYYYGESQLLKEVKYYPIVQLIIVALFIIILVMAQRANFKSTQNQIWAGLAKETAHQLGTPVSSLQGWIEMMRDIEGNEKIVPEIEKDVQRLLLITDRFGKIGSIPKLEEKNIIEQVQNMIDYIKKRASGKVVFELETYSETNIPSLISPPLFDWVIENLLKNALDAIEGKGKISVSIKDTASQIIIDVADSGKGILKANIAKVFKPGFSTKKRGWGLGLTLTKRIIEQYHEGQIFVLHSEVNKGTTFRVILNK